MPTQTHDAAQLSAQLRAAEILVRQWAHAAGWKIDPNAEVSINLGLMRSQHCDERSYSDLAASGGLPERQELEQKPADTKRLDWLDSLSSPFKWIMRRRTTMPGWALHHTRRGVDEPDHDRTFDTARAAIDAAMAQESHDA